MGCVADTFGSKEGSDAVGGVGTCDLAVGGTKELTPFLDGVFGDELERDDEVARHETGELVVKWLALKKKG